MRRDPEFVAACERKQGQALAKLERARLTPEDITNGIRDIDAECALAGPVATFLGLRIKCHELLCRINGLFIEKIEVGWGAEVAIEIEAARERSKPPTLVIEGGFTEGKDLSEN